MSALRSFLRGVASIFDFSGALYRQRADDILARSDADAIRGDWGAVGRDLALATGRYPIHRCAKCGTPLHISQGERAGFDAQGRPAWVWSHRCPNGCVDPLDA